MSEWIVIAIDYFHCALFSTFAGNEVFAIAHRSPFPNFPLINRCPHTHSFIHFLATPKKVIIKICGWTKMHYSVQRSDIDAHPKSWCHKEDSYCTIFFHKVLQDFCFSSFRSLWMKNPNIFLQGCISVGQYGMNSTTIFFIVCKKQVPLAGYSVCYQVLSAATGNLYLHPFHWYSQHCSKC